MKVNPLPSLLLAIAAMALAACTTPAPPRPAMQPLSVAGNFGFSDRNIDDDTIEVTYRGAEVTVSSRTPREDARIAAEKEKVHDLALLRAARIAQERGIPAIRIISEKTDSDVDVQSYPRCRAAPFWGPPGYWGYPGYGYGYRHHRGYYGWPDDYACSETRSAKGKATAVLTVDLVTATTGSGAALSTAETISRLEKIYATSTYP
jgi:hypothetical protein